MRSNLYEICFKTTKPHVFVKIKFVFVFLLLYLFLSFTYFYSYPIDHGCFYPFLFLSVNCDKQLVSHTWKLVKWKYQKQMPLK
jgi:hypothetical protein